MMAEVDDPAADNTSVPMEMVDSSLESAMVLSSDDMNMIRDFHFTVFSRFVQTEWISKPQHGSCREGIDRVETFTTTYKLMADMLRQHANLIGNAYVYNYCFYKLLL